MIFRALRHELTLFCISKNGDLPVYRRTEMTPTQHIFHTAPLVHLVKTMLHHDKPLPDIVKAMRAGRWRDSLPKPETVAALSEALMRDGDGLTDAMIASLAETLVKTETTGLTTENEKPHAN